MAKAGEKRPKKIKKEMYDFFDVEHLAEELASKKLGRKVNFRNYAGKSWDKDDEKPYLDYWHILCDAGVIGNDTAVSFNWKEMQDDAKGLVGMEWFAEVCGFFIEIVGDGDNEYWISW